MLCACILQFLQGLRQPAKQSTRGIEEREWFCVSYCSASVHSIWCMLDHAFLREARGFWQSTAVHDGYDVPLEQNESALLQQQQTFGTALLPV